MPHFGHGLSNGGLRGNTVSLPESRRISNSVIARRVSTHRPESGPDSLREQLTRLRSRLFRDDCISRILENSSHDSDLGRNDFFLARLFIGEIPIDTMIIRVAFGPLHEFIFLIEQAS